MGKAKIYIPAKNAMQSGKGKNETWLLEYKPETKKVVDNLMGWQGSTDMKQELKLEFDTRDAAITYANKSGIDYEVIEPKAPKLRIQSYADNFTN